MASVKVPFWRGVLKDIHPAMERAVREAVQDAVERATGITIIDAVFTRPATGARWRLKEPT